MSIYTKNTGQIWSQSGGGLWVSGIVPLTITTPSMIPVTGTVGIPYAYSMSATGGIPPYTWSLVSDAGSNNSWVVTSFGSLTCTPTNAETDSAIVIKVQDSIGNTAQGTFSVMVSASSNPYAIRAPQAGDLYLDTTAGSDGSGTFASPWNNITAARLATLTAGQALWVRQGSVVAPWPDMGVVAMNSGTAGNPIIVSCYPTGGNWTAGTWETATINNLTAGTYGGSGYSGRIMINMAYWYFKGFSLNSADTGFRLGNGPNSPVGPCSNIRFIDITGTRNDSLGNTDNSGIIQWDVNNTGLIEIVRGSWTGPVKANNQACLFFDNSTAPITVIGALVVGSARPIYFKHNPQINPGGTIKNCIIDLTGTTGLGGQRDHVAYQNNVFIGDGVNSGSSVQLNLNGGGGPGATASYATFNHNTFYGSFTANGDLTSTNNTFTNTVIAGAAINGTPAGSGHDVGQYTTGLGGCTFDYTATDSLARYLNNHTTYTLSAFAAANPPNEAHGVTGAISFVGGSSGGGHSAAGWALVGGSAGKNAANDGTDCGVNAANLLTAN